MPKLKKIEHFNLIGEIRNFFSIKPFEHIIPWAEKNINFSDDVSAERDKLDFEKFCYQIAPIKEWEDLHSIKKVTVVMPQQRPAKTNCFIVGLLWRMVFDPCASMIVYPSEELAADINKTKILPLMKRIPGLKEELQRPRSFRSDRYSFSSLVSFFQGAGSRIISKSCKIVISDECDDWVEPPRVNNMKELEKRTRSYSSSIFYQVCSPTTENR